MTSSSPASPENYWKRRSFRRSRPSLQERGLRLSPSKTKITEIHTGFDFLGANVRKYKGKLLIKPSKRNVVGFVRSIREFIRRARSITTVEFIRALESQGAGLGSCVSPSGIEPSLQVRRRRHLQESLALGPHDGTRTRAGDGFGRSTSEAIKAGSGSSLPKLAVAEGTDDECRSLPGEQPTHP